MFVKILLLKIWFICRIFLLFLIDITSPREVENFETLFDLFEILCTLIFYTLLDCIPYGEFIKCSDEAKERIKQRMKITIKKNQSRKLIEDALCAVPIEGNREKHIDTIFECSSYDDIEVSKLNGCILQFPSNMPCLC